MKGNKFLLGLVVGILFAAVIGLAFYAGTKVGKKEDTKTEEKKKDKVKEPEKKKEEEKKEEKNNSNEKSETLKKSDKLVQDAIGVMPRFMCGGINYRFDGKSRTVDKFTNEEKISMLFSAFSSEIFDEMGKEGFDAENDFVTLESKDFQKYFADLSFLKEVQNDKEGYGLDYPPAVVKYNKGRYELHSYPTGCIGGGENGNYLFYEKATKNGDELTIRYIHAYVVIDFDENKDDFVRSYYKNKGDKKSVDVKYDDEDDTLTGDVKSLDRYDFVFDVSNGNVRIKAINYSKN